MRREFKEVNQGEPQVEYKEAFTKFIETYKSNQVVVVNSVISYLEPADEVEVKFQKDYNC
jgi:elongation factor G